MDDSNAEVTVEATADSVGVRFDGISTHDAAPDVSDARRRIEAMLFGPGEAIVPTSERPRTIGRFTLLERLGSGGMGVVHAALDPELDRKLALKILRPDRATSEQARARLLREARAMARLRHPNVITVYESGTHEGLIYVAMELVEGVDLRTRCEALAAAPEPAWRAIVDLYLGAGRGLAAAHRAGLIHRDFKPQNAMVGDDGRVRVLDFGLARAGVSELGPSRDSDHEPSSIHANLEITSAASDVTQTSPNLAALTETGALMGTPAYMAPEQFAGGGSSSLSDQYSFCVALHEALFGQRPFIGRTIGELMNAIVEGRIEPPPEVSKVPARVRSVVLRGLSLDPGDRFADMDALLEALERAATAGPRRRRAGLGLAALGAATLLGYLGGGLETKPSEDPCAIEARAMRDAVWSDERREALAAAFVDSGAPGAAGIWSRVAARVDDYTDAWVRDYTEACIVEGGGEIADAGPDMVCLVEARRELDATLSAMDPADAGTVFRAIQAVAKLPSPSGCTTVAGPEDPALAERVEALRARASEVRARVRLEDYADALAENAALLDAAADVDHAPLQAELGVLQGRIELGLGRHAEAKTSFERGFWLAVDVGDDRAAVDAALGLASIVGGIDGELEPGLAWARQGEVLIRRADLEDPRISLARARARILRVAGQPALARAELDEALALLEGEGPRRRGLEEIALLRDLGGVALDQGYYDEALEVLGRALASSRASLGDEHPATANALSGLGTAYYSAGRFEDAVAAFEEAGRIVEAAHGPVDPLLGDILNNLGATLDELGRLDEAEDAYRRALHIREVVYGEDHPLVAATLDNISFVLMKVGDLDEAGEIMTRSLALLRAAQGERHPAVAINLLGHATLARRRGEYEAAIAHAEEALAIFQEAYGEDHPDLSYALIEISASQVLAGRPAAGIAPARRALELRSGEGLDPRLPIEARLSLVRAAWEAGEPREPLLRELADIRAWHRDAKIDEPDWLEPWLREHDIEVSVSADSGARGLD